MALSETTIATSDVTTNADFRAWGLAVRTALTGAGCVITSDTGQIDFTTVASPAASAFAGYDIFRFPNSTDQTNFPVFFKLEYGHSGTAARQALRLTIGTGSNGSGTINGSVDSAQTITLPAITPTGVAYIGASFFDGGLFLHSPAGSASSNEDSRTSFLIERVKRRADGVTTSGIQFISWTNSTVAPLGRFFNGSSWAAGVLHCTGATGITNTKQVLGGYVQADSAGGYMRSMALIRPTVTSQGDAGTVLAEDGTTSIGYKRPATASAITPAVVTGTSPVHDMLIRNS